MKGLDLPQKLSVTLLIDNQSCIKMIESEKHRSRTKHIDVKCHTRHLKENVINIECKMAAAIFTKPLPEPKFEQHREERNMNQRHQELSLKVFLFSKN